MRSRIWGAVSLTLLSCSILWAFASSEAQAQQTTAQDRALALFELSGEKYRAGDFEGAVELLTEAYDLFPEPVILYNLARAYEGMGESVRARDA